MELAVPLAGGLDHDQAEVVALEPTFERAMALMAVGDAERLFGGQNMDIEPGFADIDSHARFALGLLFGHILALHAGLAPHHLFRTRAEERMDQALPRGSVPRVPRSHPLASGTAAAVPDAQPLCSESAKSACKGAEPT